MADLTCEYLGLKLKSPFIVSASPLTGTIKNLKKAQEAGAGAVVLKSLFEEDMENEVKKMEYNFEDMLHPEAYAYLEETGMLYGADKYFELIKEAKSELSIPVIASLNCRSTKWWDEYADTVVKMGADALELNIGIISDELKDDPKKIADEYINIFKDLKERVNIPVVVKIGQNFTSIPNMAYRLHNAGANGLVLFNRFYSPDIDIDSMKMITGPRFSTEAEFPQVLRWTAIIAAHLDDLQLSASTGIHSTESAIKVIMAGASTVQLCSVLFNKGIGHIETMNKELADWMDKKGYASIADFKSTMEADGKREKHYERLQYIKSLREDF